MAPASEEKHRKVFISVLGAGPYAKCKYVKKDEGFTSSETLFVQQATLEYLQVAQQWNAEDVGLFLLTKKARTDNWDKSITSRDDPRTGEKRDYAGLEAVIADMNLPIQIKDLDIEDGNNEEEIWSIFNTVFDFLQAGDYLYFDVTHAFRSIPMLILVLCNYAKFLNKAEIKSITYGNYEGRDRALNQAPIIDLLPLANLQDWTYAAGAYLDTGNVDKLVELANMHVNPILKATKGHDHDAKTLSLFTKALDNVIKERQTCRGMSIIRSHAFKNLKHQSDNITNDALIKPFAPILDEIRKSFDAFGIDANIQNAYAAAKWCFDHKLYQQAATILEEAITTLFCQRHQLDDTNIDDRGVISGVFNFRHRSLSSKYADELPPSDIQAHQKFQELMDDEDLRNQVYINGYHNIRETRNDYNHSGMRPTAYEPDAIIRNIKQCLDIFAPLFAATSGKAHPDCFPDRQDHQMLLNLSNHPASGWDAAQLNAARDFGGVKDLPFPAVPPEASEGEIAELADAYCARVLATPGVSAVHLMGEMTFCFALVARLKAAGVKCVASTTRRDVVEQDGAKTSRFSFVRFREY